MVLRVMLHMHTSPAFSAKYTDFSDHLEESIARDLYVLRILLPSAVSAAIVLLWLEWRLSNQSRTVASPFSLIPRLHRWTSRLWTKRAKLTTKKSFVPENYTEDHER